LPKWPILQAGHYGVTVFFVLSGFLIGDILLRQRAQRHVALREKLRIFYLRRALRIFPLYYLVVGFSLMLGLAGVKSFANMAVYPWLLTYTTNLYVARSQTWLAQHSHLWTLAVEEQFYLVIPVVILVGGKRWVERLVAVFGAASLAAALMTVNSHFRTMSPVRYFALLFGVGMAAAVHSGALMRISLDAWKRMGRVLFMVCMPLLLWSEWNGEKLHANWMEMLLVLTFGPLIVRMWQGEAAARNPLFVSGWVQYLGRISYGLYVYHLYVLDRLHRIWHSVPVVMVVGLLLTVGAASLSWRFFEAPILRLKSRVQYSGEAHTGGVPQAGG
jgi:peptidoglycan/LPS O-acetylase OafA/YrhL